jgi:hypothetical protein
MSTALEAAAGNGQGAWAEPNLEDSFDSLFVEIGQTLNKVAKQGISTVGETVKTALAHKIMNSPEGQAQIAAYKAGYVAKYLPWFALILVAVFVGGRLMARRG